MGFNTYNDAGCVLSTDYVRNTIQSFSDRGFGSLGYKYFQRKLFQDPSDLDVENTDYSTVDCGWQAFDRQSNGSITYDTSVFPAGITPLSQFAIGLGFQWSMYTDQGIFACDTSSRKRPGSLGYERQDALQLAGWNVAYMKVRGQLSPKTKLVIY